MHDKLNPNIPFEQNLRYHQDSSLKEPLIETDGYIPKVNSKKNCFVSVVCPLENSEAILNEFLAELSYLLSHTYHNYEIILVDTAEQMRNTNIDIYLKKIDCLRYICLSRNFGLEISISAGLDHAIGDVVVVLRPDYDPVGLIPEFVDRVIKTNKIVIGLETNKKKHFKTSLLYRIGKHIYYWMAARLLDFQLSPQNASLFTAFSRQTLNAIISIKDKSRYLRVFSTLVGYQTEYIPYKSINRHQVRRRLKFRSSLRSGIDIIVMNSTRLLRYASYLGIFATIMNIIYIIFIFGNAFFNERMTPGWLTLSFQNSSFFLVLFIILTILSEYIVRLLNEVQDRPLYYVLDEKNSAVMLSGKDLRNVVAKTD